VLKSGWSASSTHPSGESSPQQNSNFFLFFSSFSGKRHLGCVSEEKQLSHEVEWLKVENREIDMMKEVT
jgi:hypothetical protein